MPLLFVLALLCDSAIAADATAWASGYDPTTGARFIPVELWTGSEWDGARVLRMPQVSTRSGQRRDMSISGPIDWIRPGTTDRIKVYERTQGSKRQLFALRGDGSGLGRVFDSRFPTLDCIGEVKFPLGYWKQGETREYGIPCLGREARALKVTIEEIDFVYRGVAHSLRFHWHYNGGGCRACDMRYTYSPLRGLVYVEGNE